MSRIVLPKCKVSFVNFFRFPIYIIFLSTIPAVSMILLVRMTLLAYYGILRSSPIIILCVLTRNIAINVPSFIDLAVRYSVTVPAALGALYVLTFGGIGTTIALLVGFQRLFSDKILPYVACSVLVLYYTWSGYSSFTNKYQDLAFALFKHYKKSEDQNYDARSLNSTDQVQVNIGAEYDDSMKIPKELFRMACEELMPISENVCVLVLKVTTIVTFVFLVFLTAILNNVGATPILNALFTILAGIFPKIVAIYIDGGRHREIEAMTTDHRIPKILREYFKKASRSYKGQETMV